MDLSVVIVNWNSTDYTVKCIESILASVHGLDFEVIVVDNASSEDPRGILQECFGQVKCIRSHENLGFARANNLAFQHSSGKCVLFLNPDTDATGSAISLMYAYLQSSPSVGAVGCRLLNADRSTQTSCIQRFPTLFNQLVDVEWLRLRFPMLRLWGIRPLFAKDQNTPAEVEVVCGACMMVKRGVFEAVQGFSTEYFMYGEDVDLCYKIQSGGWKIFYVGAGSIIHYGKQSSMRRREESFGVVVTRESVFRLLRKTRGFSYAVLYRVSLFVMSLVRLSIFMPVLLSAKESPIRQSIRKWQSILRWSIGLEPWAAQLGSQLTTEGIAVEK